MMAQNGSGKGPAEFAEFVLGAKLWSTQRAILRSIETERRTAVAGCHASGKTYTAACAALWFAARHADSRVLIVAPGWLTVRAVVWSEIHNLLSRAHLRLPLETQNQTEIRLDRSLLLGVSTNEPGRLQGHHARNLFVIVDEAVAIPTEFWPPLEGILSGGNTRLLILGNPTVNSGYFFDAFGRNRQAWQCFSISVFQTPNFAGLTLDELLRLPDSELDRDELPYLATRRWTKERYAEWWNGTVENSPLWASRVLGEFPSSSNNALIPLSWLERARRPSVDNGGDIIVGVDVAGPGKDRTVTVACCGGAIIDVGIYTGADARGVTLNFIRVYRDRLRMVRVDSAGPGWYFLQDIRDAGYRTQGVNVGCGPDEREKERFRNLKAQRYWFLRERFQRGEISGLSDEMLAELASINYLINPKGQVEIEDKASVKSILGKSPDLAEALMLAIGEHAPEPFDYRPVPAEFIPGQYFRSNFWFGNKDRVYMNRAEADAADEREEREARTFRRRNNRFSRRVAY
jgi:hypothetical protein